jgi:O-6-methylguanine DNA methyltransferase
MRFDIDLNLQGTAFQMRFWTALQDIAHGEVVCYQWIAKRIGNPAAVRAVGAANGRNPVSIIVPCHRVIGKGGHLNGYGGGLAVKHRLLQLENPDWRLKWAATPEHRSLA